MATDAEATERFGAGSAVDGDVVVVGAPNVVRNGLSVGVAYVFVKPSGGWSGHLVESARLESSESWPTGLKSAFGKFVAISGDTIVVGDPVVEGSPLQREPRVDVFVKPATGWVGTINETATLRRRPTGDTSPNTFGGPVAIDGDTVVVGGDNICASSFVYVFQKPAGGWGGTVQEKVRLRNPIGESCATFPKSYLTVLPLTKCIARETRATSNRMWISPLAT